MFGYYFDLALRSFRRNKVLTALMVLAIALGIGASMTTLTVFHVLSGDPIPRRATGCSTCRWIRRAWTATSPGEEPAAADDPLRRREALLREKRGDRQAMMTGGRRRRSNPRTRA